MVSLAPISGRFGEFRRAKAAIERLSLHPALGAKRLELVEPRDPIPVRRPIAGPARGAMPLLRRHLMLVAAGLAAGVAAWPLLTSSDVGSFADSPGHALAVTLFFGAFFGLLMCAAHSVRLRNSRASKAKIGSDCGQWTVIVHCSDRRQTGLVSRILSEESDSRQPA